MRPSASNVCRVICPVASVREVRFPSASYTKAVELPSGRVLPAMRFDESNRTAVEFPRPFVTPTWFPAAS